MWDWNSLWAQLGPQLNFQNVANGLLVAVLALLSALGIRRGKQAADGPKTEVLETKITTTDSIAMRELTGELSGVAVILTEISGLLKAEVAVRAKEKEMQRELREQRLQDRVDELEAAERQRKD